MAEIKEIRGRKYYCYTDTNDVLVVIPNWHRLTGMLLAPASIVFGIYIGWAVNFLNG